MSPAGRMIRARVTAARRRVRRAGMGAVVLVVLAGPAIVLLCAWVAGGWGSRGAGPLLLWASVGAATLAVGARLVRLWVAAVDETRIVAEAERARGLAEGSVRGVLELGGGLPAGVSAALFRRA
ncbi:MAG: hypothetical protein ACOCVZ_04745, partial [Gemmatimonadota bacterium]